jgi:adenosylmethionine-8-amino-7-oxononanoate aminotransferase
MYGGKGLGGGYAAIAGLFASEDVIRPIADAAHTFMFFTFGAQSGHCAVADKVLQIMEDEDLVERSAKVGAMLKSSLDDAFADHPHVSDVRGLGLWAAIELVERREPATWFPREAGLSQRVVAETLARGAWVYPSGSGDPVQDAIMLGPPFTISEDEVSDLVGCLRDGVDAAVASLA